MSAATGFLSTWITKAAVRSPSITRTSCQRWPGVGTPPHFKPGIVSYGWGINGHRLIDANGVPVGLSFSTYVWFSDRGLNLQSPPPASGQQFAAGQADREVVELTLAGDAVALSLRSVTWGFTTTATTQSVDAPSQQLLFSDLPAAGPDPVRSLLVIGLADTGAFGWL